MGKKYPSRGRKLEEFARSKGWSNAEFARRVGIHPPSVNRYFEGELDPMNLASALMREGCDLNWLCSDDVSAVKEEPAPYTVEEEKEIDELAVEYFHRAYGFGPEKLNKEDRRGRLAILRKLAEEDVKKRHKEG